MPPFASRLTISSRRSTSTDRKMFATTTSNTPLGQSLPKLGPTSLRFAFSLAIAFASSSMSMPMHVAPRFAAAIDKMPDLPLLIGPGANRRAQELGRLMTTVPTLKPQLASATWVGGRRWDLNFQSGETLALPEGEEAARAAIGKFANLDRNNGLLGRGVVRFDLRIPGKMIVRLPRAPGEAIAGEQPPRQSG